MQCLAADGHRHSHRPFIFTVREAVFMVFNVDIFSSAPLQPHFSRIPFSIRRQVASISRPTGSVPPSGSREIMEVTAF